MKRLLVMFLITVLLLGTLVGCVENAPTNGTPDGSSTTQKAPNKQPMVYKLGNAGALGEPAAIVCQLFTDLVNERLEGEVVFQFYPAEQLGNEITMLENLQVDLQQAVMTAIDTLGTYSRDFNIISMAFAFEDHDHLFKYLESDLAETAFNVLEDQGIHVVNFNFKKNPRIIFAKKPIYTPDDLAAVKFRIPNIPIWEKNFRTMGAVPTIVAWSEYPFALMQGVVDAGESTKEAYYSAKLFEAAPYVSEVDYAFPLEALSFSKIAWDRLTPEQQRIIEECAEIAAEEFNTTINTKWEEDKEKLFELGVEFVNFDKEAFMTKMSSLADELEAEGFWDTPGLYEKVQALR
ncbi:TRAP-type C4-dicarboxylate transport system, substrate-binding protein [Anaerovirgula multivorans]|uniref:TRAP-type C4-dicarboxylate transport system, substrate-binding protein n=1 Tax=Anaerovirgula multivorans TaxID=312168 RepID=A0A239C6U4_9FIRM|nr:TRAP transporter substrate-binding protein [Anaerovirgula multivorans]SNS15946.1 TRAP-type C4-dicarboxylate transport system, substrate-binding protein [Anaerovirgula multivorans]